MKFALLAALFLSACATLKIEDELPKEGNPYQKIFAVWSFQ